MLNNNASVWEYNMTLRKKNINQAEIKARTKRIIHLLIVIAVGMGYLFISKSFRDIKEEFGSFPNMIQTMLGNGNSLDYSESYSLDSIPVYNGKAYVKIKDKSLNFDEKIKTGTESFYEYSELDYLDRSGPATACIGYENLTTEERGDISSVHPSGWQSIEADDVEGGWLYNRSHLIANCLGGPCGREGENEEDLEKDLITGTRYMNVEGMEHFELMVQDYIYETHNHVLYKVIPVYDEKNLLASGVLMEAYSIEDNGQGINFCVYVYNVQPGYNIDYSNGNAW